MKYAIIENGKVVNTVIADSPHGSNWVQSDTAGIGDVLDGNIFNTPSISNASSVRILTHLQYMNRFTNEELRSIYTLAKTVVDIEIWLDKFRQATHIDLDEPELITGLNSMVSAGLLTSNRPAEIRA